MTLRERLNLGFLRRLIRTPEGRTHVLHQIADAEGSDEARVFERTLARVDDPKLAKMIEKHSADEKRHEALFRACAERRGVELPPTPPDLRMLDRLDGMTGRFLERPITDGRGVMEAYLLLQVIEERAITQFGLLEQAFREVDPVVADTFAEVARDEQRHLRYCHAIARRYAPDEATHQATLARFRGIEAEAYAAHSRANMKYIFARGWFDGGALVKLFWRALAAVQSLGTPPPAQPTPATRPLVAAAA